MKRVLSIAMMPVVVDIVNVQTIVTLAGTLNAGKDFANTGKGVVEDKINGATGSSVLPYYSITASGTVSFQEGRNLIDEMGMNKQIQCEAYKIPNVF